MQNLIEDLNDDLNDNSYINTIEEFRRELESIISLKYLLNKNVKFNNVIMYVDHYVITNMNKTNNVYYKKIMLGFEYKQKNVEHDEIILFYPQHMNKILIDFLMEKSNKILSEDIDISTGYDSQYDIYDDDIKKLYDESLIIEYDLILKTTI